MVKSWWKFMHLWELSGKLVDQTRCFSFSTSHQISLSYFLLHLFLAFQWNTDPSVPFHQSFILKINQVLRKFSSMCPKLNQEQTVPDCCMVHSQIMLIPRCWLLGSSVVKTWALGFLNNTNLANRALRKLDKMFKTWFFDSLGHVLQSTLPIKRHCRKSSPRSIPLQQSLKLLAI